MLRSESVPGLHFLFFVPLWRIFPRISLILFLKL